MGCFSFWLCDFLFLIFVLLFGRVKISYLLGEVARGIKSFKRGLAEDDSADDPKAIASDATERTKEPAKDKVAG